MIVRVIKYRPSFSAKINYNANGQKFIKNYFFALLNKITNLYYLYQTYKACI